jgi:chemotaxis protein histidine kinase CheA
MLIKNKKETKKTNKNIETKELENTKENIEAREAEEIKELENTKENIEAKELENTKENIEAREAEKTKKLENTKENIEAKELENTKENIEAREVEEAKELENTKENIEAREAEETKELENTKENIEAKELENTKENIEAREAEETKEYCHCKPTDKDLIILTPFNKQKHHIYVKKKYALKYKLISEMLEDHEEDEDELIKIPIAHKHGNEMLIKNIIEWCVLNEKNSDYDSIEKIPKVFPVDKKYNEVVPKWISNFVEGNFCIEKCSCKEDDCECDIKDFGKPALRKFMVFVDYLGNKLLLHTLCFKGAEICQNYDIEIIRKFLERTGEKEIKHRTKEELEKLEFLNLSKD